MQIPTIKTLNNGLRVIYLHLPGVDTATLYMGGRAGSNYETNDEVGIAHLLEHGLFNGTEKYPSSAELERVIEDVGGYNNAYTSSQLLVMYSRVLKNDIEKGLDFLSQLSMHPLFKKEDIENEIGIVTQEAIRKFDQPVAKFHIDQHRTFFPNQRHGKPVIGDLDDIAKIDQKGVQSFYDKNFVAENFNLAVCADLEEDEVFGLAEKYFSEMCNGDKNDLPSLKFETGKAYFLRNIDEVNQATLSIYFDAPKKLDFDEYPTVYLSEVLAGTILSRLFQKLRVEKGYAYSVSSRYFRNSSYGHFTIESSIAEDNFDDAIKIIRDELNDLSKNLVSDDEFKRIKKQVETSMVFSLEYPEGRTRFYQGLVLKDIFPEQSHEDLLKKALQVDKQDILDVAKKIFSGEPKIGVLSKSLTEDQVKSAW